MSHVANKAGWALAIVLGGLLILAAAQVARGGSLDPPGLPGSTMKTLDEVEPRTPISSLPYVISQPGSYYVTTDLTGVSGQHGITINSHNVTLDLNGFTLTGVPGALDGIHANAFSSIAIRNGMVRLWPGDGIDAASAGWGRFEGITANNNTGDGISVGSHSLLEECVSYSNGGDGVEAQADARISNCEALSNTLMGFRLTHNTTLHDCLAADNSLNGIYMAGEAIAVSRCSAEGNLSVGIWANGPHHLVEGCIVKNSGAVGVRLSGAGGVIRDCSVSFSANQGIHIIGANSRATGNSVVDHAAFAAIWVQAAHVTVDHNYAATSAWGIYVQGTQAVVENNTVIETNNEGIFALAAVATACTIEGNTVTGASTGYSVAANLGCSIVRNVAKANTTNYAIGGGNDVGPITTGAAQASPAGNVAN